MRLGEARQIVGEAQAKWTPWNELGDSTLTVLGTGSARITKRVEAGMTVHRQHRRVTTYDVSYYDAAGEHIRSKTGLRSDLRRLRRIVRRKLEAQRVS